MNATPLTPHCVRNDPKCLEFQAKQIAAITEFKNGWPNACNHCGGSGAITYRYDPSPAGVSLGSGWMEDSDPCPECVEKGICPLCGRKALNDDGDACSVCGWSWNKGPTRPEVVGCECDEWDDIEILPYK